VGEEVAEVGAGADGGAVQPGPQLQEAGVTNSGSVSKPWRSHWLVASRRTRGAERPELVADVIVDGEDQGAVGSEVAIMIEVVVGVAGAPAMMTVTRRAGGS